MNITKEQLRKVLSDGFDENMTDVDNWNEAVFYNNKDKFIEDVVNNLSQHLVSKSFIKKQIDEAYNKGYSDGLKDGLM